MDLAKRLEIAFMVFPLALGWACGEPPVGPEPATEPPVDDSCISPGAQGAGCFYPRAGAPAVGVHCSPSDDLTRQTRLLGGAGGPATPSGNGGSDRGVRGGHVFDSSGSSDTMSTSSPARDLRSCELRFQSRVFLR